MNQLTLSLQFAKFPEAALHRAALPRHKVARWLRAALQDDAELTVRIVDAAEGQALNRDYRKKDYATNVLTFDYTQEPVVTADLVLCAPVVAHEAKAQNKTLEEHYKDSLSFKKVQQPRRRNGRQQPGLHRPGHRLRARRRCRCRRARSEAATARPHRPARCLRC